MNKLCVYNFKLQNKQEDTIDLHIDGVLVDAETEDIYKEFLNDTTSTSYRSVRNTILNANPRVVNIYVNSPGGSVIEAMAIHDFIQQLKKDGVITNGYGIGIIASASTYILSGCENSFISPNSIYMIHNLSGGIYGNIREIENYFNMMKTFDTLVKDFYTGITGKTKEQITDWMDKETYFTGKEAVENGFVKKLSTDDSLDLRNEWNPEYFQFKNKEVFNLYNKSIINNKEKYDMNKLASALINALKKQGFFPDEPNGEPKNITEEGLTNSLTEALKDINLEPTQEQVNNSINELFKNGLPENVLNQINESIENATKDLAKNEEFSTLKNEVETIKESIINKTGGVVIPNNGGNGNKYEGIQYE